MENPTYNFTETNFVLQLIQESQIKIKTLMSWRSQKKRIFFVPFLYSKCETFLANVFFLMYSVLNAFSEYRYFYISKHITSQFFYCFFFKFAESIQLIFNYTKLLKCLLLAFLLLQIYIILCFQIFYIILFLSFFPEKLSQKWSLISSIIPLS